MSNPNSLTEAQQEAQATPQEQRVTSPRSKSLTAADGTEEQPLESTPAD